MEMAVDERRSDETTRRRRASCADVDGERLKADSELQQAVLGREIDEPAAASQTRVAHDEIHARESTGRGSGHELCAPAVRIAGRDAKRCGCAAREAAPGDADAHRHDAGPAHLRALDARLARDVHEDERLRWHSHASAHDDDAAAQPLCMERADEARLRRACGDEARIAPRACDERRDAPWDSQEDVGETGAVDIGTGELRHRQRGRQELRGDVPDLVVRRRADDVGRWRGIRDVDRPWAAQRWGRR